VGSVVKLKLRFGVIDMPYTHSQKPKRPAKKKSKKAKVQKAADPVTTGEVAEWLERNYEVFAVFFEMHEAEIVAEIETGLADTVEALMMGAPLTLDPFGGPSSRITTMFKQFLANSEIETYPGAELRGLPTIASGKTPYRQGGINHRLRHPYAKTNPPRPSLIDTATFQNAAVAEVIVEH